MTGNQENLFWANVLRPFAYLLIWVVLIYPVTWAVMRYMKPGRLKDALLKPRWTSWRRKKPIP